MTTMDEKKSVRRTVRDRIALMTDGERAQASGELCRMIAASREWVEADNVLLYMALPDEISLSGLMLPPASDGKRIWLPVMDGESLQIRLFEQGRMNREQHYGIWEPDGGSEQLTDPAQLDLAVIPGRAFTQQGHRLGRGKGYYDRLLPQLRCPLWGVAFGCQMMDTLPTEQWDIMMHKVLSAQ